RQIHTALLLGGGMYTIPMHIHKYHPEVEMDVIEIDESTLQIAKDFFYYKDCDQIHIHFDDAMHYIQHAKKQYDFIFCDVYDGIYIPEAFLNLSTIQIIHTLLHKDGIYAINIPGPLQYTKQSELYSFVKKVKSIFSHVYLKAAISPNQKTKFINYVLYASDAPLTLNNLIEDQG
ncbi:MAG: fused MFS/spermidine synthase, partial [Solobacterium sp.]|nr:fused MFS/spermidine synthase [Solobacterium sp.]